MKKLNYKLIISIVILLLISMSIYHIYTYKFKYSKKEYVGELIKIPVINEWKLINNDKYKAIYKRENSYIEVQSKDNVTSLLTEIVEDYKYLMKKENAEYNIIGQVNDEVTLLGYNAYKLLYENKDNYIMVVMFKSANTLVTIKYEANKKVYDLLLDSANELIAKIQIQGLYAVIDNPVKLEKTMEYEKNDELDKLLDSSQNKTYTLTSDNRIIKLDIPDIFINKTYDTLNQEFNFKDNVYKKSLSISTKVSDINKYDFIDTDNTSSTFNRDKRIYEKYEGYKTKVISLEDGTIVYVLSYIDNIISTNITKYYILKEIDKNTSLTITVEAVGYNATKKLIEKLATTNVIINTFKGNLDNEDNNIILKRSNNIDYIINKDKDIDIELDRYNYLGERRLISTNNDISIRYELFNSTKDSLSTYNSYIKAYSNNNRNELVYTKDITLNNILFKEYQLSYVKVIKNKSYNTYATLLIHDYKGKEAISIYIEGNTNNISEQTLNSLTNIKIEERGN